MTKPQFEIRVLRQHWIQDDGKYDPLDLCSHGEIFIRIGERTLSDSENGAWTLTACGLFLMRSLVQNCELEEFENFMVPCCGNTLIANDPQVVVLGCDTGIDWKTQHVNETIHITTDRGSTAEIPFSEYKVMVKKFVDEVEEFYGDPSLKEPENEIDKEGFVQFWNEWKSLKALFDL